MESITITRPSDFHLHFREGDYLKITVKHISLFHYTLAMPNLKKPITTIEQAEKYRKELFLYKPVPHFTPLMTIYLQENTPIESVKKTTHHPYVLGFKLYPQGVTTQSNQGVNHFEAIYPILEQMEKYQVPLMIHGETPRSEVDIFDREKIFIDQVLDPISIKFPKLIITLEHISTQEAVEFINGTPTNIKATITPHHLYLNRNHLLSGGINPHHYCMPILKRREHQTALIKAATSGSDKFFLGTDSAPHTQEKKESPCGCAGIYTSPISLAIYAEIFEQQGALEHLEKFASINGCNHYKLEIPKEKITLKKEKTKVPEKYHYGSGFLIPFKSGKKVLWTAIENSN